MYLGTHGRHNLVPAMKRTPSVLLPEGQELLLCGSLMVRDACMLAAHLHQMPQLSNSHSALQQHAQRNTGRDMALTTNWGRTPAGGAKPTAVAVDWPCGCAHKRPHNCSTHIAHMEVSSHDHQLHAAAQPWLSLVPAPMNDACDLNHICRKFSSRLALDLTCAELQRDDSTVQLLNSRAVAQEQWRAAAQQGMSSAALCCAAVSTPPALQRSTSSSCNRTGTLLGRAPMFKHCANSCTLTSAVNGSQLADM